MAFKGERQIGKARRIATGFRCHARRAAHGVVLVVIVLFGVIVQHVLTSAGRRAAGDIASLCAQSLEPGPGGDLADSIDHLRAAFGGLAAVGTLDAGGRLRDLRPENAAYRKAINLSRVARDGPVKLCANAAGRSEPLWMVVVPLNGDASQFARRVVLLLDRDGYPWNSPGTILLFVAVTVAIIHFGFLYVTHWFDDHVSDPLQCMARSAETPGYTVDHPPLLPVGGWSETGTLADRLQDLCRRLAASEARADRLELEARREIETRQRGFDQQLRRVEDKATVDPLTRARNRTYLDRMLEPTFEAHVARGEDIAIVMLDIDNFKIHNDTYGHSAGDDVLRFLGDLLRSSIRPTDTVVRYGGDEFVLLLPEIGAQQAAAVVDRMIKLFGQYVLTLSNRSSISLSAGVASLSQDACSDGAELLQRADEALYRAKRAGKNMVATAFA